MSELPLHRDPDESLSPSPDADGGPAHARPTYAAVVVTDRDGTEECTIFPLDRSDDELVTRWVSASDGSFVSLAAMR